MSKTIKLENKVYHQLDEVREKRETFSNVVGRLLALYNKIEQSARLLGPSHFLKGSPPPEETQEE